MSDFGNWQIICYLCVGVSGSKLIRTQNYAYIIDSDFDKHTVHTKEDKKEQKI